MNAISEPIALDRTRFLGGTDMAALYGVSKWKTPLQVWAEKTHRDAYREDDPAKTKVLNRGKRLEPVVVAMLREDYGLDVVAVNERYTHPDHVFLSVEIDFEWRVTEQALAAFPWLAPLELGSIQNGEVKTVHPFVAHEWGDMGTDDVPIHYAAQSMTGLAVTGREVCLYATLVGVDDLTFYAVRRDQETIDAMVAKAVDFWTNHILTDIPPDPETFDDLKFLYARDNGQAIEATDEILAQLAEFRELSDQSKRIEERRDELKFGIQTFMEPNAILTAKGEPVATWKSQSASRLDGKALALARPDIAAAYRTTSETRVFRLKGAKK